MLNLFFGLLSSSQTKVPSSGEQERAVLVQESSCQVQAPEDESVRHGSAGRARFVWG